MSSERLSPHWLYHVFVALHVRDGAGDNDDNDTDRRQYLHAIRRNYAFLSENDGLEGPASGPFPIGLALRSCPRAARSRRGGQMQLSFE